MVSRYRGRLVISVQRYELVSKNQRKKQIFLCFFEDGGRKLGGAVARWCGGARYDAEILFFSGILVPPYPRTSVPPYFFL